ncbi:unnamed protein product, partial [Callosobruchus maculatus]
KTVVVHKILRSSGEGRVDVLVDSPFWPLKYIHIDNEGRQVYSAGKDATHEVEKRASKLPAKPVSQSELLDELLKEFQGAISDKEYEKLLSKVYKFVKSGDLDPVVYEMLFEMTVTPVDPADKKPNTEISPASPLYPIYRDWMNYKMSLVNDKIGAKTPYNHPLVGYNVPAFGYNNPAYGYDRPAYGYDRPSYGYDRPAYGYDRPAYGYDRPAYGYERPAYAYERSTYGPAGVRTPVERIPYQAPYQASYQTPYHTAYQTPYQTPYHYGPYSQDYQRTTYEGVAHPTYTRTGTAY